MSETPPNPTPPGLTRALPRVLIVDASELGGLLYALLQRHRIEAVLTRTAAAALDAILAAPPQLAIVDLDLPDASGVDLLHILRQPPDDVPVVFVGSTPKDELAQNTQRGVEMAQGFFQKPLHARKVLDHVTALLGIARVPTFTPATGVPIPSNEEDHSITQQGAAQLANPFDPQREGMSPESLPVPSMAPMATEGPAFNGPTPQEELAFEVMDVDVMLVESDLPAPSAPPPLPPDAEPSLLPMPQEGSEAPAPAQDLPAVTLPDAAPPQVTAPPPPPPDSRPPPDAPDPTDLMAMWMRKRQAFLTAPPTAAAPVSAPPTSGELAATPLAALLDAFYSAQESGSILMRHGAAQRRIGLLRGAVTATSSNVASEQVSALLAAQKWVPADVLAATLATLGERRKDLLPSLVKDGHLTRDVATQLLQDQRQRVLKACFAWKAASYELQFGPPPPSPLPALNTGRVILRGVMGLHTLLELRQLVPADRNHAPRTDSHHALNALQLTSDEARVVIACDGTKSVADLLALSDLAEQELLGMLLGLETLRLIKVLPRQPARPRGPTFF